MLFRVNLFLDYFFLPGCPGRKPFLIDLNLPEGLKTLDTS
jgi:hypothetical protein